MESKRLVLINLHRMQHDFPIFGLKLSLPLSGCCEQWPGLVPLPQDPLFLLSSLLKRCAILAVVSLTCYLCVLAALGGL